MQVNSGEQKYFWKLLAWGVMDTYVDKINGLVSLQKYNPRCSCLYPRTGIAWANEGDVYVVDQKTPHIFCSSYCPQD